MDSRENYINIQRSLNTLPTFNTVWPFKSRVLCYMLNIRNSNYLTLTKTQHNHTHYELHILIDATAIMNIENRISVVVPEGGAILLAPGTYHSWEDADSLYIHLTTAFVIDEKHPNPLDLSEGYLVIEKNDVFDFITRYIIELDYDDTEKATALISYSFAFLMCEIKKTAAKDRNESVTGIPKHNYVERAKRYVLTHLKERPTVEKVAENVYISAKQLNRLFKKKENITLGEYIDRVICYEAKRMLINKEISMAVIANNLGFSSAASFSNFIKYHLGKTPGVLRQIMDVNDPSNEMSSVYK